MSRQGLGFTLQDDAIEALAHLQMLRPWASWFSTHDVANDLGIEYSQAYGALARLRKQGRVESAGNSHFWKPKVPDSVAL